MAAAEPFVVHELTLLASVALVIFLLVSRLREAQRRAKELRGVVDAKEAEAKELRREVEYLRKLIKEK